ncbi:MAG: cyclic di-GMP phosphodiesterase [Chloroflexota bacterium]|nr:cyclic di-GMP phosphodiesterase [Chloroflexota bacterium]
MAVSGREQIPEELVTEDRLRQASILVVERTQVRALMLERILAAEGYGAVTQVADPWEVVDAVVAQRPAVVLLSMEMPELDGFSVLQLMAKEVPPDLQVPVILVGDDISEYDRGRGLESGAFDFLSRPLVNAEVLIRTRNALRTTLLKREAMSGRLDLEEQLRIRTSELDEAQVEILERLALAAEYCDDETGDHARRVGMISGMIARELGLNPSISDMIRRAAPLHDVGKIGIPEHILTKPGPLTEEEMAVMKTHTTIGAKIVFGSHPTLWLAGEICMNHHERWNGQGYPSGKSGDEIPLVGRIVAVADVYDTLCGSRSYRKPWPHDEAFEEIKSQSGRQFDAAVVDAFLRLPHPLFVEVARVVDDA